MMTVTLIAVGIKREIREVGSLQEASAAWNAFRDEHCLGAREMLASSGVIKVDGKKVGNVSYNGRVWVNNRVVC